MAHEKYREVDVTERAVLIQPNPFHPIVEKIKAKLENWGHCRRLAENEIRWRQICITSLVPPC